jgi:hypothetical protein
MNCPKCSEKTRQLHHRKLTTGRRLTRECQTCGFTFVTLDQGQGEQFFREDTGNLVDVTDQQRRAFDRLCYALSTHPEAIYRRDIIPALERCRLATKVRGRTVKSYFNPNDGETNDDLQPPKKNKTDRVTKKQPAPTGAG